MLKELNVLETKYPVIKIHAEWDLDSAKEFTNNLYEYVAQSKISFELNTRRGSIINEFIITIFEGIASAVVYDLIKFIFRLLKKEKQNKFVIKPVHIFTLEKEYVITGGKDSIIPEELKEELFK